MQRLEFVGIIPGIAFTSSSQPEEIVECEIVEHRYQVKDNYKVQFQALDTMFGSQSFYIMDFEQIVRQAKTEVRVYALTSDGYRRIPNSVFDYSRTPA
jgi:hypothetical protein